MYIVWALLCFVSIQSSDQCSTLIIVENAKRDESASNGLVLNSQQLNADDCKNYCLFNYNSTCKTASWDRISNMCKILDQVVTNILPDENNDLYYVSQSNSSNCGCNGSLINQRYPFQNSAFLRRVNLEPQSSMDISSCASNMSGKSFVFDFMGSTKCFELVEIGHNNIDVHSTSYIYIKDIQFFSQSCSLDVKFVNSSTPRGISIITSSPLSFQSLLDKWDKGPLAIRPAYVVLVGLGGACLVMTLVAVVALCQGKLSGRRNAMGKMKSYSEGSNEPVEISNLAYQGSLKESDTLDMTHPQDSEYFDRNEVID